MFFWDNIPVKSFLPHAQRDKKNSQLAAKYADLLKDYASSILQAAV